MPTTSKEIVLGKVPKRDERKFVVVILIESSISISRYLANQEPITTPCFGDKSFKAPLLIN